MDHSRYTIKVTGSESIFQLFGLAIQCRKQVTVGQETRTGPYEINVQAN